ncbi:MAG: sulfur oxidation c-type cytochrome SoxA [Caldimonas sp.]
MKRALVLSAVAIASWAWADDSRRSGFDFMSPATQAMQRDDMANPGMLWVQDGETVWNAKIGVRYLSCASCHGDAAVSMRGVAARYPAFDSEEGIPLTLRQRIVACRQKHQWGIALAPEGRELLSLESYVTLQSRGMPIAPPDDPRLEPFRERGRQWFEKRMGQLNFSCAQCHGDNAGQRLGGSVIPQAHPTGYPIYRLEWQGMGSLQRRLRNCMSGVRAEPFPFDSREMSELELYLAQRAGGMRIETPAVRP